MVPTSYVYGAYDHDDKTVAKAAQQKKNKLNAPPCPYCNGTDHQRASNKICKMYGATNEEKQHAKKEIKLTAKLLTKTVIGTVDAYSMDGMDNRCATTVTTFSVGAVMASCSGSAGTTTITVPGVTAGGSDSTTSITVPLLTTPTGTITTGDNTCTNEQMDTVDLLSTCKCAKCV